MGDFVYRPDALSEVHEGNIGIGHLGREETISPKTTRFSKHPRIGGRGAKTMGKALEKERKAGLGENGHTVWRNLKRRRPNFGEW